MINRQKCATPGCHSIVDADEGLCRVCDLSPVPPIVSTADIPSCDCHGDAGSYLWVTGVGWVCLSGLPRLGALADRRQGGRS
jgi:hypothetical protein